VKRSLDQHADALRNMQAHYGRHMDTLKRHEEEAFRLKSSILKLEAQIAEAKRLNKDGFDEGKFMQRRKANVTP
jgi:hypothetical protein